MTMLKELRKQRDLLVRSAAAKLALITDQTSADEARKIETEHEQLLSQIRMMEDMITRVDSVTGNEVKASQTKKKAKVDKESVDPESGSRDGGSDEDDENDDEEDDDDEDETDKKDKKGRKRAFGKKRGGKGDCEEGNERMTNAEFAEMVTIDTQARSLGIDLDLPKCLEDGKGPDDMRRSLFAELAKKSRKGPQGGDGSGLEVISDEREGRAEAMEIALITRMLDTGRGGARLREYKPKNVKEAARVEQYRKQAEQYLSMGLVDIAAACIDYRPKGYRGRYLTASDSDEIFTRAFNSTSDFPNIFQNVLNKALLARYELHMPTYRELAVERPFNDFRPHPQIRAGEFPVLQPLSETGEIKYGTTTDNGETASVVPYGIIFTISRTMLVNDDLGAIDQILGSAGDTVLVFENTTFFNMMLTGQNVVSGVGAVGPTLVQDGLRVFDATANTGHNNYLASGAGGVGAPSIATIGNARQQLRTMKSLSGNFLNVPPTIILTGPAQETVADQMVTAIAPTLTTSVNPFSGRLRSVSDANIIGNQFYLFTDPARVPCFMYGFLNGANGPRTRTFEPFGVQGVKISLEHDFGCGAIDYRGAYLTYGS